MQPPAMIDLSVKDMPAIDRLCRCALPILFWIDDAPKAPGIRGTCIAVELEGKVVFVTALHVMKGSEPQRGHIAIPLGFGGAKQPHIEIAEVFAHLGPPPAYEDAFDIAVLVPATPPPLVVGESLALDLTFGATMDTATVGKTVFAVCGYPRNHPNGGNMIDYDRLAASFFTLHAIGIYAGPSPMLGCHQLTVNLESVGGPDGFSGGPVFRAEFIDGAWEGTFAGMMIRGGPNRLHFIENGYLLGMVTLAMKQRSSGVYP
jgi:hypothetical protein